MAIDEPDHKSLAKLCPSSPDGLHWWDRTHITGQYTEHFKCRWCDETLVD